MEMREKKLKKCEKENKDDDEEEKFNINKMRVAQLGGWMIRNENELQKRREFMTG